MLERKNTIDARVYRVLASLPMVTPTNTPHNNVNRLTLSGTRGGDLTPQRMPPMNRLELTDLESEQLREAVLTLPIGRNAPIINAVREQLPETDRSLEDRTAKDRSLEGRPPEDQPGTDRPSDIRVPHGASL